MNHPRLSVLAVVLLWSLCLISGGCAPSGVRAPASDIEMARDLLIRSLEQWRAGTLVGDLLKESPPIYFSDDAYVKGIRLLEFKLKTSGEMYVTNVKFDVELSLAETSGGAARETSITYLVTTTPALTISRLE